MKNSDKQKRDGLSHSANRLLEDCQYSSTQNFILANYLGKLYYILGFITAFSAFLVIFTNETYLSSYDSIIPSASVSALVSSTIVTIWNPSNKSELYQRLGNQYLSIQKRIQKVLDLDVSNENIPGEEVRIEIDKLYEERESLYDKHSELTIPNWVHRKAKKIIKRGDKMYEFEKAKKDDFT